MKEVIGKVEIDYEYYHGEDLYSDGPIENELLDIVKYNDSKQYNQIIAKSKSWPILYHLSHIRGNIVSWMNIDKSSEILEIGSGCGAITTTLADKAGYIDCIELSKKRSYINAYKNRECDNICIHVGNFEDIEPNINKQYDYITLIGVLEYAGMYIHEANSYQAFLKKMYTHLKPGGKLIVAIENKYGLKYWAGCREDHIAEFFGGLEGYSSDIKINTFSRRKLEELLRDSGFNNRMFYYPYPDYKLPLSIYSDDSLPKPGDLNNNMRNFDLSRMMLFDETKVWNSLIEDELFQDFSNSFLVIAGRD